MMTDYILPAVIRWCKKHNTIKVLAKAGLENVTWTMLYNQFG
jgi:hypothetical protein